MQKYANASDLLDKVLELLGKKPEKSPMTRFAEGAESPTGLAVAALPLGAMGIGALGEKATQKYKDNLPTKGHLAMFRAEKLIKDVLEQGIDPNSDQFKDMEAAVNRTYDDGIRSLNRSDTAISGFRNLRRLGKKGMPYLVGAGVGVPMAMGLKNVLMGQD